MSASCPLNLLFVGSVWPEPESSAGGVRTMNVIESLRSEGMIVTYCSPARADHPARERLERSGVACHAFLPNDSAFDAFVETLRPDVAIFDRFMLEEQFSWRVRERAPECVRILDTIDLHALRRSRERVAGKVLNGPDLSFPVACDPSIDDGEDRWRELASILRSDLSWVVSPVEATLLRERFGLARELVEYHPVRGLGPELEAAPGFSERQGFAFIGNFRHAPNLDAVQWLKHAIWPLVRQRIPQAIVRVYGSYPVAEATRLHDPKQGFHVEGWVEDAALALAKARVNLAPLRFGAGVKGKIIEGWRAGTPVVGTSVAAEGLQGESEESAGGAVEEWGGEIADSAETFAARAIALHEDPALWNKRIARGRMLYREHHWNPDFATRIAGSVRSLVAERDARRERHWLGSILWHHQFRSTKYLSRWIEAKERLKALESASLTPST